MVFHAPHISLRTTPRKSEGVKFSLVVSRKVAKRAVDRNLLKRRGRHVVRDLLRDKHIGHSGVFFFKKGADTLPHVELKEEITALLEKSGAV